MKKYEQYKKMIMFLLGLFMVAVLTAAYGYVWYEHYLYLVVYPFLGKGNLLVILIYAILIAFFLQVYSGYKFGYLKLGDVIFSQVLSIVITNEIIFSVVWSTFASTIYHKMYPPHKTLMIYGSEMKSSIKMASSLEQKMKKRSDKYRIKEMVDVSVGLDTLKEMMRHYDAVLICDVKTEMRNKILKYCFEKSIRTYITPKISDIIVRSADDIHLFDTPLLLCRNCGLNFEQRVIKRLMDIVISLVILTITSPIMLVTAIAIKAYDHGPAFFKQKRCTINGKVFEILKFRSMIVDAEKPGMVIPAKDRDPRITPVGRFIRATRIDELPQLINVLKGEMSIVGPRPERVEHVEKYSRDIPEFSYRLKVKGGLTGYAQVLGKYNTTAYDKLKLDLMYIENYSIALDLKLLLMTIKIVFSKESTEGFEEENN